LSSVEGSTLAGHTDRVRQAAFSPDGSRILTASLDTTARLWTVPKTLAELIAKAKIAVPRCLTAKQRQNAYLAEDPPNWCLEMRKWPYDGSKAPQ
jgi:WD40 repeat protein